MSDLTVFVMIRDGNARYFEDYWSNDCLFRELTWGPNELEKWLEEGEELQDWPEEVVGGAVVDFDQRRLVWLGVDGLLNIPRVATACDKLLQAAWPGFEVSFAARGVRDLAEAAGEPDAEDYEDDTEERWHELFDAADYDEDSGRQSDVLFLEDKNHAGNGRSDGHEFQQEMLGNEDWFDDEDERAWITVVDLEGAVRHRNLQGISEDLIQGHKGIIERLMILPAADIPSEEVVIEGMWIDQQRREVGLWGGHAAKSVLAELESSWSGYSVSWTDDGYRDQCAVSGPSGLPMSQEEALAKILPSILSTERFDIGEIFQALGGELRKTAVKATGCLVFVLCAPVLLLGAISGTWKAVLITVGIIVAVAAVIFRVLENRFKAAFATSPFGEGADFHGEGDPQSARPPTAGPLDERERRERLDRLLESAGLPPLAKVEPYFLNLDFNVDN